MDGTLPQIFAKSETTLGIPMRMSEFFTIYEK